MGIFTTWIACGIALSWSFTCKEMSRRKLEYQLQFTNSDSSKWIVWIKRIICTVYKCHFKELMQLLVSSLMLLMGWWEDHYKSNLKKIKAWCFEPCLFYLVQFCGCSFYILHKMVNQSNLANLRITNSEHIFVISAQPLKMFRFFFCRDHVNGRSRCHSQASLSSLHGGQRSSQAATPETVRLLQASLMADSDRESRYLC